MDDKKRSKREQLLGARLHAASAARLLETASEHETRVLAMALAELEIAVTAMRACVGQKSGGVAQ